jgi:hypothetical protein
MTPQRWDRATIRNQTFTCKLFGEKKKFLTVFLSRITVPEKFKVI